MRALTVWQPWASLIMVEAKPWEFRGRSFEAYANAPAVGERIVLHAGARPVKPAEVEDLLIRLGTAGDMTGLVVDKARELLERVRAAYKYRLLPLACALGTVELGTPRNAGQIFTGIRTEDSDRGSFNWAWPMLNVQPFAEPIPMRGAQGFFNCSIKEAA
jgi:hypothetical protein